MYVWLYVWLYVCMYVCEEQFFREKRPGRTIRTCEFIITIVQSELAAMLITKHYYFCLLYSFWCYLITGSSPNSGLAIAVPLRGLKGGSSNQTSRALPPIPAAIVTGGNLVFSDTLPESNAALTEAVNKKGVQLESVTVRAPMVFLSIRVLNASFEKKVRSTSSFRGRLI